MAGQPEQVTIPAVPTSDVLTQALGSLQGQIATFTNIYQDMQNTAQTLRDHVSQNGVTHDALDTMQGIQNGRLTDMEQRMTAMTDAVRQLQQGAAAAPAAPDYAAIAQTITAGITASLNPVLTAIATAIATPSTGG